MAANNARPEVRERKNAARRGEHRREDNLRSLLRSRYGITFEDYQEMLAAQDGRCAICRDEPDPNGVKATSRLHVDHCHATGRVRQLLCSRCNQGLGYFRDRPDLLEVAATYLRNHLT